MDARREEIRKAALRMLDERNGFGGASPVPPEALPFGDDEAGRAVAARAMAAVRSGYEPGSRNEARTAPRRGSRIAWLAAAAALVAVASSALTMAFIRRGSPVEVRFVLEAPEATSVWLAADFNDWSPSGYELEKAADGTWSIIVPLRRGASYSYNFVIDGERWVADPSAPSRLDDGLGGVSSSLSL